MSAPLLVILPTKGYIKMYEILVARSNKNKVFVSCQDVRSKIKLLLAPKEQSQDVRRLCYKD
ncbi:MAG: hypothetical protein EOO34_00605 [Cyanobacteriota bacterium]|nr:MAG: hypothetical protein EOO34_00605 [Cyanobacteriota bacterium]